MNKTINCLMLKTTDQRCFFTHQNNFPQLIEFARTCEAEISVVKTQNVKVMELNELAKSICNHGQQSENLQYEVIEVKLGQLPEIKTTRSRKRLLSQANIVSSYIKDTFRKNKIVSLSDLETKFSEFKLSKPALCNHIARVRSEMEKEGYTVSKIKRGSYQMTKTQTQ
jgi:hypothetical protein